MTNFIAPNEIRAYIFSFLEPEELAQVSRVSKEWNEVQKIEELWKRHCLDLLEDSEPYRGSWKEQFKVMYNWLHARGEKKTLDSYDDVDAYVLTILEDSTLFTVYFNRSLQKYVIHNFSTDHIIPIEHETLNNDHIIHYTIDDKTCVCFTKQGKILFFDLLTGQYLKKISLSKDVLDLSKGYLTCNDQEIIISYNNKIEIWDKNTLLLTKTIDVSKLGEIIKLNSTSNFIICHTYENGSHSSCSIRKKASVISPMKCKFLSVTSVADSREHFAMKHRYTKESKTITEICIFRDDGEDLTLIPTIEDLNIPTIENLNTPQSRTVGSLYIYKNWLLATKDGVLNIYDIKTT